jgi:hypothetical protein
MTWHVLHTQLKDDKGSQRDQHISRRRRRRRRKRRRSDLSYEV